MWATLEQGRTSMLPPHSHTCNATHTTISTGLCLDVRGPHINYRKISGEFWGFYNILASTEHHIIQLASGNPWPGLVSAHWQHTQGEEFNLCPEQNASPLEASGVYSARGTNVLQDRVLSSQWCCYSIKRISDWNSWNNCKISSCRRDDSGKHMAGTDSCHLKTLVHYLSFTCCLKLP